MIVFPRQTLLSLAAIYFFAPFVRDYLSTHPELFDTTQKEYIESYISRGYITGIASIISLILLFFVNSGSTRFPVFSNRIPLAICIGIFYATIMILAGKKFGRFLTTAPSIEVTQTQGNLGRIFWDYIPFLSIISRYRDRHDQTGYRRAKESMIVRTIRALQAVIIQSPRLSMILLCAIIARIATLTANIDIVPLRVKQYVSQGIQNSPRDILTLCIHTLGQGIMLLSQRKKGSLTDIVKTHQGLTIQEYTQNPVRRWRIPQALLLVCMVWTARSHYQISSGVLRYIYTHIHRAARLILILHPLALMIYGKQLALSSPYALSLTARHSLKTYTANTYSRWFRKNHQSETPQSMQPIQHAKNERKNTHNHPLLDDQDSQNKPYNTIEKL